jgi:hypothetical protein
MRIELSCYRKRQFIGKFTEIVSGRTVVVGGGGLKEDGNQTILLLIAVSV